MASRLYNLGRMTVSGAPGAGNITLNAAVPGFLSFALAGVANGAVVRYGAKDGNAREVGYATYSSAGNGSLTGRTIENSTNGGAALNLSANAIISLLPSATDFGSIAPQCGRLLYASGSALSFVPKNGNKLKIAGKLYDIPSGGLPGLGNTGIIINGTAGQNLAGNTSYLVLGCVVGGVATGAYSTDLTHSASNLADNEGVEISNGMGNGYTVLGIARMAGAFADALIASWFNRRTKSSILSTGNVTTTATAAMVDLTGALGFVTWGDEFIHATFNGQVATSGTFAAFSAGVDSGDSGGHVQYTYGPSTNSTPALAGGWMSLAEGYHWLTGRGAAASGSGTLSVNNSWLEVKFQG